MSLYFCLDSFYFLIGSSHTVFTCRSASPPTHTRFKDTIRSPKDRANDVRIEVVGQEEDRRQGKRCVSGAKPKIMAHNLIFHRKIRILTARHTKMQITPVSTSWSGVKCIFMCIRAVEYALILSLGRARALIEGESGSVWRNRDKNNHPPHTEALTNPRF